MSNSVANTRSDLCYQTNVFFVGIAPRTGKESENLSAITTLIQASRAGDLGARSQLFERLYTELRTIAHARLRGAGPQREALLLDTGSLVNESYLKLISAGELAAADRQHFLAYAARVMRSIVVDQLRGARAAKRGDGLPDYPLTTGVLSISAQGEPDTLRVHEAMEELGAVHPRLEQLVELRYFGGLSEQESAEALGVSRRTVQRDWEKARLFLATALEP